MILIYVSNKFNMENNFIILYGWKESWGKLQKILLIDDETSDKLLPNKYKIPELDEDGRIIFDGDVEEAISIYSGIQDSEFRTMYSFMNTVRPSYDHGKALFVEELTFINKKNAIYRQDEKINIKIIYSKKLFRNIILPQPLI